MDSKENGTEPLIYTNKAFMIFSAVCRIIYKEARDNRMRLK